MEDYNNIFLIIKEDSPGNGMFLSIPETGLNNINISDIQFAQLEDDKGSIHLCGFNDHIVLSLSLLSIDEDTRISFLNSIKQNNAAVVIFDDNNITAAFDILIR